MTESSCSSSPLILVEMGDTTRITTEFCVNVESHLHVTLVRNSHYENGWCHLYITKCMLFQCTRSEIALHFNLDVNCVRLFSGKPLLDHETPEVVGMRDGDYIVMLYDPSMVFDVPLSHALNARQLSVALVGFVNGEPKFGRIRLDRKVSMDVLHRAICKLDKSIIDVLLIYNRVLSGYDSADSLGIEDGSIILVDVYTDARMRIGSRAPSFVS